PCTRLICGGFMALRSARSSHGIVRNSIVLSRSTISSGSGSCSVTKASRAWSASSPPSELDTSTRSPASCNVFVASSSELPLTAGTSTAVDRYTPTRVLPSTPLCDSAGGSVLMTWLVVMSSATSLPATYGSNPLSRSASNASSFDVPLTSGTGSGGGPLDRITVTG